MTQFESNDAILKGITSSRAGRVGHSPAPAHVAADCGVVLCSSTYPGLPRASARVYILSRDTSPHPVTAHASAFLLVIRCGTEKANLFSIRQEQMWCSYHAAELVGACGSVPLIDP